MTTTITQYSLGGAIAFLILKEVFTFLKSRNVNSFEAKIFQAFTEQSKVLHKQIESLKDILREQQYQRETLQRIENKINV